jgi:uncharacterized protein (TIGR02145 family)
MRIIFLLYFMAFMQFSLQAQVGIGTTTPAATAQLDVSSTSKGFLPPRMTTAQRDAILNPADGLIIFNTTTNYLNYAYNSFWWELSRTGSTGGAHSCGTLNVHNTPSSYGRLVDQDGNTYLTITIGTQTWMAENLKTTKYRDGSSIPNVTNHASWSALTTGAWCTTEFNVANNCPYGKLYNFYAVVDARGLCPSGWHVPTDPEWATLITYLGGATVAGGRLKSTSTLWTSNTGATNDAGFSALPGGFLLVDGSFSPTGFSHYWWSTTESVTYPNRYRTTGVEGSSSNVLKSEYFRNGGNGVRCVRD